MSEHRAEPVRRWPRAVAGIAATGAILVAAGSLAIWGADGFEPLPVSFAQTLLSLGLGSLAATAYVIVGWIVVARAGQLLIGWLLLAAGLVVTAILPVSLLVAARPAEQWTLVAAWLLSSFATPAIVGLIVVAGLVFPDGRFLGPSWLGAAWLAASGAGILGVATAVDPAGLVWFPGLPNPVGAAPEYGALVAAVQAIGVAMLTLAVALLVASMVIRHRRGDAIVRAQLRWIAFATAVQGVSFLPFVIARYLLETPQELGELLVAVAEAGSVTLPIAAAVAIQRYRLFGIDRIISRTLVYVPLMAVLGGLYTAGVLFFQRLFVAVTGETSDAAVVGAAFIVAATFTPVRRALEGAVERWTHPERHPPLAAPADEEVLRTALSLVALRRLEDRFARPDERSMPALLAAGRLAIDGHGRVACPATHGGQSVTLCLGCSDLRAVITRPPSVVCAHRPSGVSLR